MEKPFPHITCGVCSKPYNDPRILSCLHSFCLQCLHHEIDKSGSQQMFQCPICEQNTSIPVGGASVLPQNLHLGFEVEVAGYMSKMVSNSEVCCDECVDGRNGLAVVFCCMCRQFLCKHCRDHHSSSRKLSKHKIVGLDQEGARQLQMVKAQAIIVFCLHGVLPWTFRETFMLQPKVQTLSKCLAKKVSMSECMVILMVPED